MSSQGFEEARSNYTAAERAPLSGQFRRFGEAGPAYEVIRIASPSHAFIRVVYSGEELDYSLERMRADPIAETIP